MRHDHFVSQLTEQPAYPGGMGSGLQCDETPRYLSKGLLHRLRRRRQLLFQNALACFIQNTIERPAIAEVQTNRELVSFENHVSIYPNSASLFHSRSPFLCALSTSNTGSVSHPAETGLLIPSEKRDYRVRRERRWSTAGVYPPGNWFAPPGSYQSSSGGNETAEASGAEGRKGGLASVQAVT